MEIYRITFAGHREIDRFFDVEKKLDEILTALLRRKEFIDFYIGNDGEFDRIATAAIRRVRKKHGDHNSTIHLVLPYRKANLERLEEQYDSVIIPEELYGIHPKSAISRRNRWMVEQSDLLICYVTIPHGGAFETVKYASKTQNIEIINLSEFL